MTGPAPKHPSARRRSNNAKSDFTILPVEGRSGPVPVWPLKPMPAMVAKLETARDKIVSAQVELESASDGRTRGRLRQAIERAQLAVATLELQIEQARDEEAALWAELWATPQAVVWEQSHSQREVAQYVRWKVQGEQGDLEAAKEARMLADRLGLNPLALLRLRLEIEHVSEAEARGDKRRAAPKPVVPPADDPRNGLYAV